MSLSYQRLDPVLVKDPVTILGNKREYAVLKSGSQATYKQFTTTSVSNSSIQFSCPPPSGGIIVDRKVYFMLPVRLTFTGTAPVGQTLLKSGTDAPREFPISSAIDTLQVTINNQSVSINMADIIHPLLHFNADEELDMLDYSMTPSYPDQSQAYSQLFGTNRNPLGFYGDSLDKSMMGRAGFPFNIVTNPLSVSAVTPITAVVDVVFNEPIFLSPFYWGHANESGFYNVNTMDFNITFLGNAGNRMWSHDATSSGTTITGVSAQFTNFGTSPAAFSYVNNNQPLLLFKYITPLETEKLPFNQPITYPYFDIQRFPTDSQNVIAAGTNWQFVSNNIQLNSIPRRMYIYIRERNQDLYNTCQNTDSYFSVENISVQFQNKNGLLSSANKRQLYEMAVKNHCNMSWSQWSGEYLAQTGLLSSGAGPFSVSTNKIAGIGSILCIEFATDIGLNDIEAPGKLGQYMLQINGLSTNVSNRAITPTMYIVVVSEGTFTVEGIGKASTNIGVISSQDILDAMSSPWVDYNDVQCVNGGNFLSGLKSFGNKLWKFAKETKAISKGLRAVPNPYAQMGATAAESLGLGYMDGGVAIGGRRKKGGMILDRGALKNRLHMA
jgi:hypothetical protein